MINESGDALQERAQELKELRARMVAGAKLRRQDVDTAQARAEQSRLRAIKAHLAAAKAHLRAAAIHKEAADLHELAARSNTGDVEDHWRAAKRHRVEAKWHKEAARRAKRCAEAENPSRSNQLSRTRNGGRRYQSPAPTDV